MKVVCDSSTLIALARTNHLDILEKGVKRLIIPQSVFNEVVIKGAGKPGSDEIKEAKWIETKNVSNEEHVTGLNSFIQSIMSILSKKS